MGKYRYMMSGSFSPQNRKYIPENTDNLLGIDIPAPFTHDTEKEAMADQNFGYRFGYENGEVVILVYPSEDFAVTKDNKSPDGKRLDVWTVGKPFCYYTQEKFKEYGGIIYYIPPQAVCPVSSKLNVEEMIKILDKWKEETKDFQWNAKDYEIKATFKELFPSINEETKPVYIDNEAYYISES